MLLDRGGDLVQPPQPHWMKRSADESLTAGLDPRVGPNVRLGDDPAALPASLRAQAEPHIARHPARPDFLAATFQEGRFTDGGAADCGYSISQDGGLSWSRALIPRLTPVSGGPYYRSTDPVVGVDLSGNIFINMLGALDSAFNTSALLICRSTNNGLSFEPPVEILRSTNPNSFIDKNWMAINTFPGTPTTGRIVSTFTLFGITGYPIGCAHSDDTGRTWFPLILLTPTNFEAQGSQPVFLPNGELAVVYWNFAGSASANPTNEYIEVVVSTNGGNSFNYSNRVAQVHRSDAPLVRDGIFLPAAAGNRTNSTLYVAYQGLAQSQARILFVRSPDAGVTWSAPIPISDNPTYASVFNPAIAVSPDGHEVSVIFYDSRVHPDEPELVDLFLAQSFDGGITWQPNLRLSSVSTDVTRAPLTATGYMLGDYQGVAPPEGDDVPAVGVFIDTRTGSPDPFIARCAVAPQVTFSAWRAARFSENQIRSTTLAMPQSDPDGDGAANVIEYAFSLNPWMTDAPVLSFGLTNSEVGRTFLSTYERLRFASDLNFQWYASTDLIAWSPVDATAVPISTNSNPQLETVASSFATNGPSAGFYRLGVQLKNTSH